MFTEGVPIDWSTAESLAFGTLLKDGFSVDYQVKTLQEAHLVNDTLY